MRIKSNDPVRAAVAGRSGYYDSLGDAMKAVGMALSDYGYVAESIAKKNHDDSTLRYHLNVSRDNELCSHWCVCSFYTMPSGKCELTAYIS